MHLRKESMILVVLVLIGTGVLASQLSVFSPTAKATYSKCFENDGGMNPQWAGVASIGPKTVPDRCLSATRLRESYCSYSGINIRTIDCRCKDNQCV